MAVAVEETWLESRCTAIGGTAPTVRIGGRAARCSRENGITFGYQLIESD
jgi:hypothetical protein